ncbi:hypothetical protein [Micromonospora zingiberis]|uniref:hypothetical protein n=1 Tax=Micromonospora zingiberis TaxID=2053011 RepID=UPI0013F46055|nr:hypothetical protein [Micromonospora zingiberis]
MSVPTTVRAGAGIRRKLAGRFGAGQRFGRRAVAAFCTNGLSSVGNLVVSVAVARGETLDRLGQFALAFSIYVLVTGLVRTTVTEAVLAERPERMSAATRAGARRAILLATVAAVLVSVSAAISGSPYLLTAGLAMPGLVLYDYIKATSLGVGVARIALTQEGVWTGCIVAAVLVGLVVPVAPLVLFGIWAAAGAVVGIVVALRLRYLLLPAWGLDGRRTRVAAAFAAQFMVTTGSAQLALTGLAVAGGAAGVAVVGALGATRTLFGPVTLLMATLSSLIIPYLGRIRPVTVRERLRTTGPVIALAVGLIAPVALAICLLPEWAGELVLADNWSVAQPLLPLIAVETVLAPIAVVGFAGHRVQGASLRALSIGGLLGPVRIVVIVAGGVLLGAPGAAGALALIAVVSASCWWISYLSLGVKGEHGHESHGRIGLPRGGGKLRRRPDNGRRDVDDSGHPEGRRGSLSELR